MTPEQFCYWLQGFVEMNPNAMLTHTQWVIIKDHLKLVMNKQTPNRYIGAQPAPVLGPRVLPDNIFNPGLGDPYMVTC